MIFLKKTLSYNQNYTVAVANNLIRGQQTMTLQESKLLYITISQIVKQDTDLKTYTTTIPELANFLNISADNLYRDIDKITDNLMKRVVKIKQDENKWKKFQWVNYCEYDSGILTIRLSDDIKPYVIALEKYYSQYLLGTLVSFKSYYTSRIYQILLCEMREKNKNNFMITFTIEEIRDLFMIEKNKYSRPFNLISKTIEVARMELIETPHAEIVITEIILNKARTRGTPIESVTISAEYRNSICYE